MTRLRSAVRRWLAARRHPDWTPTLDAKLEAWRTGPTRMHRRPRRA